MEKLEVKSIEEIEQQPTGVDALFLKREIERDNARFKKSKRVLFIVAILLANLLVCLFYFTSSMSKVTTISVSGNQFLTKDYIRQYAKLDLNSRYYLIFSYRISSRLEQEPFIQQASVTMKEHGVVEINVVEKKPVGYRYENETPMILFSDNTKTELTSDYLSVVARIPFMTGFETDEQTYLLTKAMNDVHLSLIEDIAEIHQYDLGYDQQAIQVQMRDGGFFFASYYSLDLINSYHEIYGKLKDKNTCLFADQGQRVVYAKVCPWLETVEPKDYWMDGSGNYILNKYGDKVLKHFYQDDKGNYYLDASGNWILIPIDEEGNQQPDDKFLEHYTAGYYATGQLVIPEQE